MQQLPDGFFEEFFQQSLSKVIATIMLGSSFFAEIGLTIKAMFAESDPSVVAPNNWEHLGVIGVAGIAIAWLLRERERDRISHVATVKELVDKMDDIQKKSQEFREGVIKSNTEALVNTAKVVNDQKDLFDKVARELIDKALGKDKNIPS